MALVTITCVTRKGFSLILQAQCPDSSYEVDKRLAFDVPAQGYLVRPIGGGLWVDEVTRLIGQPCINQCLCNNDVRSNRLSIGRNPGMFVLEAESGHDGIVSAFFPDIVRLNLEQCGRDVALGRIC